MVRLEGRLPVGHLLQGLDGLAERGAFEPREVLERREVESGVGVLVERVQRRGRGRFGLLGRLLEGRLRGAAMGASATERKSSHFFV